MPGMDAPLRLHTNIFFLPLPFYFASLGEPSHVKMDDFYTVWKVDGLHNVVLTPLVPLYVTVFSHIFQSKPATFNAFEGWERGEWWY